MVAEHGGLGGDLTRLQSLGAGIGKEERTGGRRHRMAGSHPDALARCLGRGAGASLLFWHRARGEWEKWVTKSCEFSRRMARNYVAIARGWEQIQCDQNGKALPICFLDIGSLG